MIKVDCQRKRSNVWVCNQKSTIEKFSSVYFNQLIFVMIVAEAEKYHEEDEKYAQRIQARNGLESCAYNLREYVHNLRDTLQVSFNLKVCHNCQ